MLADIVLYPGGKGGFVIFGEEKDAPGSSCSLACCFLSSQRMKKPKECVWGLCLWKSCVCVPKDVLEVEGVSLVLLCPYPLLPIFPVG